MHDRIERSRTAALGDALGQLDTNESHCSAASVLLTFTETTYPTTAATTYATHPVTILGDDTEGAAATLTADTAVTIYALNLGSTVPPSGTYVLGHQAGGRWGFRWDG